MHGGTCNANTWEVEEGQPEVKCPFQLHTKFEASLDYKESVLKTLFNAFHKIN